MVILASKEFAEYSFGHTLHCWTAKTGTIDLEEVHMKCFVEAVLEQVEVMSLNVG